MKSYHKLNAEMDLIQQQMVEAKKNKCADAFKELERFYTELDFTAGMLKGTLATGQKRQ